MRIINRRPRNPEKVLAPAIEGDVYWGAMGRIRDELLFLAEKRCASLVAELKQELDALAPTRL